MKKKAKRLDCVEMKRRAQERVHEKSKDMTPEQQRFYFNDDPSGESLTTWYKRLKLAETARRRRRRVA